MLLLKSNECYKDVAVRARNLPESALIVLKRGSFMLNCRVSLTIPKCCFEMSMLKSRVFFYMDPEIVLKGVVGPRM